MGKTTGFLEYSRQVPTEQPPQERIKHYKEFIIPLPEEILRQQGARCMNCGVPFCHSGCPLGNIIPEFNDFVYRQDWQRASQVLHSTNNFPEFTGRICPAPCEEACVLGINEPAVTIKNIEYSIAERAFNAKWIKALRQPQRTGKSVAVIGSGPAGLACADQLNRVGHRVTVFERADQIGGLLRYGIPDFKLEKWVIDRRLSIMSEEGIEFCPGVDVGKSLTLAQLQQDHDAVALCIGATKARDLVIPGRELKGVHFAMEFLPQQNRRVAGLPAALAQQDWWFSHFQSDILATDKHVIVIGGGDTGADCVGTSIRQGAKSITQFELLPIPPAERPEGQPWPYWPNRFRSSSSHKEGCERHWGILTREFIGENGELRSVKTVNVEWKAEESGRPKMHEQEGTERIWPADLVLLAMGFTGPETAGLLSVAGISLDNRSNIRTGANYMTNIPGVFACGDARRGQSLVVWAMSEGREAAREIDIFLMGETKLRSKGLGDLPRAA